RRICRLWNRHDPRGLRSRRRIGVPQQKLFPRGIGSALVPAGMAYSRHALCHSCRASRREIQLHPPDLSSALWADPAADGHIPGDRIMTSPLLWTLIVVQLALGLFDIVYHHEIMERLAWRSSQRRELKLHGARNLAYAVLFPALGLFELRGFWAMLIIAVLAAEVVITLVDFVEEDLSRKLPASERVTHTLLPINYGAILGLLPILVGWARQASAVVRVWYGIASVLAPLAATGVVVFGLRDYFAARRMRRLALGNAADLVRALPSRQSVLITGATGFIGRRL